MKEITVIPGISIKQGNWIRGGNHEIIALNFQPESWFSLVQLTASHTNLVRENALKEVCFEEK